MLSDREKTLSEFIIEEQRRSPGATGAFTALLNALRITCKRIAWLIGQGVQGASDAARLDSAANDIFFHTLAGSGHLAGMASKAMELPYAISSAPPLGRYLLVFDPLDRPANVEVNVSVGSTFAVLRAPAGVASPTAADYLRPGTEQVAAGYALYGPTTMIVLTVGRGVHGFTLDRGFGEFILTHPSLKVPGSTHEFAVNTSNARFWEPPVQRYIEECVQGTAGARGKDFTMRWIASPVADVHRILVRGGISMYPAETHDGLTEGRLCLLYEASPLAMLVEQAGGAASTGSGRILEVTPRELHQRVPVILGSCEEVERIEQYYREHDQGLGRPFSSPLFNQRSLFPSD